MAVVVAVPSVINKRRHSELVSEFTACVVLPFVVIPQGFHTLPHALFFIAVTPQKIPAKQAGISSLTKSKFI